MHFNHANMKRECKFALWNEGVVMKTPEQLKTYHIREENTVGRFRTNQFLSLVICIRDCFFSLFFSFFSNMLTRMKRMGII